MKAIHCYVILHFLSITVGLLDDNMIKGVDIYNN